MEEVNFNLTPEQERMFIENERLVYFVAQSCHFTANGIADYDDLLQEGRIGLCRAVMTFDPERNIAFSTYAIACIQRRMYRLTKNIGKIHENEDSYNDVYTQNFVNADDNPAGVADFSSVSISRKLLQMSEEEYYRENIIIPTVRVATERTLEDPRVSNAVKKNIELLMLYVSGYSLKELALKYGVSRQSISTRINNARRYLRNNKMLRSLVEESEIKK